MKVIPNTKDVPLWDCVTIHSVDFHPTFDGDLVNIATCMLPQGSREETVNRFQECARIMAAWILDHRKTFGPNDRFQLILGWPLSVRGTGRQVIKTGGTFNQIQSIADSTTVIPFMPGWDKGIFKNSTERQPWTVTSTCGTPAVYAPAAPRVPVPVMADVRSKMK